MTTFNAYGQDMGAVGAISNKINTIVGTTATLLTRPDGFVSTLVIVSELHNWRYALGDRTDSMSAAVTGPAYTITDDSGDMLLRAYETARFRVSSVTVKGYQASSKLTYFWV